MTLASYYGYLNETIVTSIEAYLARDGALRLLLKCIGLLGAAHSHHPIAFKQQIVPSKSKSTLHSYPSLHQQAAHNILCHERPAASS